jgi:HEAT repeat protein
MRKRVQVALAILSVALVSVIVWHGSHEREPVYQGKGLRAWLGEYYDWGFSSSTVARNGRNAAEAAVRQIGTNAIPTLLDMLRKKDSPLVTKLIPVWSRHVARTPYLPMWVAFPSWYQVHAEVLNHQASMGFEILRTNARPAVPALINLYEENISPSSQNYVSRSLIAIGPDATRAAIPSFLRGTASPNVLVRKNAVMALSQVHDEPSLVVSTLAKSLNDNNVTIRVSAAWGLGAFGREVRQAISLAEPVLTQALCDPDGTVRGTAACSLQHFGAEAKQAVPALLELLKDKDMYARGAAAGALEQIDPEAAAKAGVK